MAEGIRFVSAGPLSVLAIIVLIGLIIILIPLMVLGIIGTAFTRLGLSWIAALGIILLMAAGSTINIPLWRIQRTVVRSSCSDENGYYHDNPFRTPVWDTVISLNLGGGIAPVCIAGYLVYRAEIAGGTASLPLLLCTALVAVVSFLSTREIPRMGLRVPLLIPALSALLAGIFLSGGTDLPAAVTALAGGVVGTLVGGNLAHLARVREIEVPEISIGGSGTFGAVFVCCILPALIA